MTKVTTPKRRASPPPRVSETTHLNAPPKGAAATPTASAVRPRRRTSTVTAIVYGVLLGFAYFALSRYQDGWTLHTVLDGEVRGHAPFDDGRKETAPREFVKPVSDALFHTNVMLGNDGPEPDLSGGMIPAVAPPFAMTRWTPQTRLNYVSMCPYNQTDTKLSGFIGTHQPAVWMGESGPVQVHAGIGPVITDFLQRAMPFKRKNEYASANYYANLLHGYHGDVRAELSATSRVGHLRFTFHPNSHRVDPYVVLDASRRSVFTNDPNNVTYPLGYVHVDTERNEIYGWNDERQDKILLSEELPAKGFKGYFVARFSEPIAKGGVTCNGLPYAGLEAESNLLSGWASFARGTKAVDVRVGVSFIGIEQARRNIDLEIPDGQTLAQTSRATREAWAEKLDRLSVSGATAHNKTVLYTGFAHTLVYPYEVAENTGTNDEPKWKYYSGYLDKVVSGLSYSGYSIWDTFRATTAWQLLVAPERSGAMVQSMLQDFVQGGWMPMWKNIVETNIMVATHADSVVAQALHAGVSGFDKSLAYAAVMKNAFVPPDHDESIRYWDRQQHTPQEVRAGLTEYMKNGWVANDRHSEAGSRTLDYAYDDHAAALVARLSGDERNATLLEKRSKNYKNIWNKRTGFMEARNEDGSWAGEWEGWCEGDHWAYSLTVMHDIPGLVDLMGGKDKFEKFADAHFEGGHNLHTNEPSHHIPYVYALAGIPSKTQHWARSLAESEYNHTALGLSGNEDCGQMSAFYLFTALGFYPVDPASGDYVLGAPLFDKIELRLPAADWTPGGTLSVKASGVSDTREFVKGLRVDDEAWNKITINHKDIMKGAKMRFSMAKEPQSWPEK